MVIGYPTIILQTVKKQEDMQIFKEGMNTKHPLMKCTPQYFVALNSRATVVFGHDLENNPKIISSLNENVKNQPEQCELAKTCSLLVAFKVHNEFMSEEVETIFPQTQPDVTLEIEDIPNNQSVTEHVQHMMESPFEKTLINVLLIALGNSNITFRYFTQSVSAMEIERSLYSKRDGMSHFQCRNSTTHTILYIPLENEDGIVEESIAVIDNQKNMVYGVTYMEEYPSATRRKAEQYFMLTSQQRPTFQNIQFRYPFPKLSCGPEFAYMITGCINGCKYEFGPTTAHFLSSLSEAYTKLLENLSPTTKKGSTRMPSETSPSSQETCHEMDEDETDDHNDLDASMHSLSQSEEENVGDISISSEESDEIIELNVGDSISNELHGFASTIICGTTNQTHDAEGVVLGMQCTVIAATALLPASEIDSLAEFNSNLIDDIILQGSAIFHELGVANSVANFEALTVSELPPLITAIDGKEYVIQVGSSLPYSGGLEAEGDMTFDDLKAIFQEKITNAFLVSRRVLLVVGSYTYGIMKESNGTISVFDSHAKNHIGKPDPNGLAQVRIYASEERLFLHLHENREGRFLAAYNMNPIVFAPKQSMAINGTKVKIRRDYKPDIDGHIELKKGSDAQIIVPGSPDVGCLKLKTEHGIMDSIPANACFAPMCEDFNNVKKHCRSTAPLHRRFERMMEMGGEDLSSTTEGEMFDLQKHAKEMYDLHKKYRDDIRYYDDCPLPPPPLNIPFEQESVGEFCEKCLDEMGKSLDLICNTCLNAAIETHGPAIDAIVSGKAPSHFDKQLSELVPGSTDISWSNYKKLTDEELRKQWSHGKGVKRKGKFFDNTNRMKASVVQLPKTDANFHFNSLDDENCIRFRLVDKLQIKYNAKVVIPAASITDTDHVFYMCSLYFLAVMSLELMVRIVLDFLQVSDRKEMANMSKWEHQVKERAEGLHWKKLIARDADNASTNNVKDKTRKTSNDEGSSLGEEHLPKEGKILTYMKEFMVVKHIIKKKLLHSNVKLLC